MGCRTKKCFYFLYFFTQNSIRHNLSLHSKFVRVQNEGNGKSSWWVINPDAKGSKTNRGRSKSLNETGQKANEKKRGRKKDKLREEGDRPGSPRLSVRNRELNRSSSPGNTSPTSSSSDSLLTVPELVEYEHDSPLPFPLNDSFGRPRTSSNASTVSSIGRLSPIPSQDDDETEVHDSVSPIHVTMASTPNPAADELTALMADSMNLRLQNRRIRSNSSPVHLSAASERSQEHMRSSSSLSPVNGYDTGYESGYLQPIQHHRTPALNHQRKTNFNGLAMSRRQQQYQGSPGYDISAGHDSSMLSSYPRDSEMEVHQHTQQNPMTPLFQQPTYNNSGCSITQPADVPMDSYDQYLYSLVSSTTVPTNSTTVNMSTNMNSNINSNMNSNIHHRQQQQQQQQPMQQQRSTCNGIQLQRLHEKFPSDLELDAFHEELECDMDTIITNELNIGDGGFDFDFEHLVSPMITNTPVTVGELSGRLF